MTLVKFALKSPHNCLIRRGTTKTRRNHGRTLSRLQKTCWSHGEGASSLDAASKMPFLAICGLQQEESSFRWLPPSKTTSLRSSSCSTPSGALRPARSCPAVCQGGQDKESVVRAGTEKWRRFNRNALIRAGNRRDRHTGDRIVRSAAV